MAVEEKKQDALVSTDRATYKILNYFKKEPSIGIACVSAVVVIVSFLINVAIYLREAAYLDYWELDIGYVFLSSPNQFYHVCGMVLHTIISAIALSIVNGAYEAFIPARKLIFLRRSKLKAISTDVRNAEKQLEQIRKKYSQKQTPQERMALRKCENVIKENKKKLVKVQKENKELNLSMVTTLLVHLIISGILLWIDLTLYFALAGKTKYAVWVGLAFAILSDIVLYGLAVFSHRKSLNKKQLRKADIGSIDVYIKEWYENEKKYPIELDWRFYLNDNNIAATLFSSILYVVLILCMFSAQGRSDAQHKDTFSVIKDNDQTYVSVYTTDEVAILERCVVDSIGEELIVEIDTKKQKIIPLDDIEYEVMEFDRVEILSP